MEVTAKLRYLRTSPRKIRLLADLVRGLTVAKALKELDFSGKRASGPLAKLIKSAIANGTNNFKLEKDNLFIKAISVDEGPAQKRWRARAFGRAAMIKKRSSHINLVLAEIKPTVSKVGKAVKEKTDKKEAVKIVKSLDEIKDMEKDSDGHEHDRQEGHEKIEKTTIKKDTKRRLFSRKSG